MSATESAKVLIFDADDTLWENNVLFERVIDDFLDWIDHPTLGREQTRKVLDDIEAANAVTHGYGAKMLLRSLHDCFEKLNERPATEQERAKIDDLAGKLVRHEVELIAGVTDTLDALRGRYRMLLLTKGDLEEQQRKLDASGLAPHFDSIHIVPEKNTDTYLALIAEQGIEPDTAWMIGNSMKSDVGPARAAGMNAVYIPNEHTWVLEFDDSVNREDERVLFVEAFPDLLKHF
ncbi:HAD family hydrolase [Lentzea nigeriaca]|uniref:HAD family hydrolase n=1 Tax=Lentzea nigeriaca TaxID=1128665 RepID=UPI0027DBF3C1|nr:HAD family hydrolase [Lentzea nigeriaca]MBM7856460.1 putative hydrolase of the HAD superfamily [Lentzea nigeriaca]